MGTKILAVAFLAFTASPALMAQSVSLGLGSGSGLAGSIVSVPISISSAGGALPTAVQWTFSLPAGVTVASVDAGASATSAGKSLSCGGSNCLVFGLNSTPIPNGTLAVANLQLAAGASGTLAVNLTGVVASDVNSIPASGSGGTITVTVPPPVVALNTLSCGASSVASGGTVACTVTLTTSASAGGFAVGLSSNNGLLTVPGSVTVASGQTSAGFNANAGSIAADGSGIITANAGAVTRTATISLISPAALSSLSCTPGSLNGGQSSSCTVSLNKASVGGTTVTLSDDNANLTTPASVAIPNGANSAAFSVTAGSIASNQTATVTASLSGVTRTAQVALVAPAASVLSALSCSPNSFSAAGTATCTVSLTATAAANATVTLADNSANVTEPGSVTILAGQSSVQFAASVSSVSADEVATISASLNGGTQNATLTLTAPAALSSLSCAPASLNSGQSSTCTVSLNKTASSTVSIGLSDDNATLTTPASVNVGAGASSANFTVTAGSIASGQTATVTASLNGVTRSSQIGLAAPAPSVLSSLSCSPNTFSAAGTSTCTVSLTAAAAASATVTLSDNSANVSVPGSVTVPTGQSSAQFSASVSGTPADEIVTLSASLNGGTQTANLTLNAAASLSSLICTPASLNSGQSSTCTVSLSKTAASTVSISLSDDNATLTTPASVNIGGGASSTTFSVTAGSIASAQTATVTASLNGVTRSTQIGLAAPAPSALSSLSCSPNTFSAAGSATCTVSLTAAAATNATVTLSDNSGNVSVPGSVTVLTGQSTAQFSASVSGAPADEIATINASLNGGTQTANLTLTALSSLSSLSCTPSSLNSGQSATCTVSLTKTAAGALTISLSDDSAILTTPSSVDIGSGSSSASFVVTAGGVASGQIATVTALLNGVTRSMQLGLAAPAPSSLSSLSCSPNTFSAAGSANCTVSLTAAAAANATVSLSDNSANVSTPGSVTVLTGQTSAQFVASVTGVPADEIVMLSASLNGGTQTSNLTLTTSASLSSVSCAPTSLNSGQTATCTVNLSKPSAGGVTISLSDDSEVLSTPASVAIGNGASSGSFAVTAGVIASGQTATVTATLNGILRSAQVGLAAPASSVLSSLSCSANSFTGVGTSTCTLTLSSTAAVNATVTLSSSSANVVVPGSATILAGQSSAQFAASVASVSSNETVTISASVNGGTKTTTLSLIAPAVSTLTGVICAPASLTANQSATCTVSLDKPSAGGTTLTLSDDSEVLSVPPTVTIANGATTGTFTVTAGTIGTSQTANISATLNGTTRSTQVGLVAPSGLSGLSCSPSSFPTAGTATCSVTLVSAAGSTTVVTLSDSSSNVTVPGSVTVLAGQTGAQFSAAVAAVQNDESATITAALNGGTQSATLTLVGPTVITGLTCAPGSLNSSQNATCTVALNKAAFADVALVLSDDSEILATPASAVIPKGASSGSFVVTAGTVAANQTATVLASVNGSSKTFPINLTAASTPPATESALSNLVCNPSTVNAGGSSLCVVTLSSAAVNATSVGIFSDNDGIAVAASVIVPAGTNNAQFRVNIPTNATAQQVVITASLAGISKAAVLSIVPPAPVANPAHLSSLGCSPSRLGPGETGVCTVYLKDSSDGNASPTIVTSHPSLTTPGSVTIPAGAKFQTFNVSASESLLSAQTVDITVNLNGESVGSRVELVLGDIEPDLTSFNCSLSSLTSGGGTVCVINLKSAMPFASELSLSSSNGLVQVPTNLTVTAGATNISFAIQAGNTEGPVDVTLSASWHGRPPLTKLIKVVPHSITIDVPSATFARAGTTLGFDVKVTHSGGLGTELIALGTPSGSSLRGTRFSWATTESQIGEQSVTFRATDVNGLSGAASARVVVRAAKPVITGLFNPAGYTPIESCSPNAVVTFLGSGFSLHDPIEAPAGAWPTELAGVRIRINGVYAPITFVSDTTLHFQCPSLEAGSSLEIVLEYEAGQPLSTGAAAIVTVAPVIVRMTEATPGVYLIRGTQGAVLISGTGLVAGPPVSSLGGEGYPARAAVPGEYLEIYANGLGSTTETLGGGKPAPLDRLITVAGTVTAVLGDGLRVPVAFAGLTPGSVGLFQVNVLVPAGAPLGNAVPLYLELAREDGTVLRSNTVTVGIAAGR
ncbi:MAG: hypothetical protein ABIR70_14355 [Bryobacteraceae bacterium]